MFDQIELGGDFESMNEKVEIRGFKRSHGGNTGHYFHPSGGSSPIHHSYRVNYGIERKSQKFEASAGRYITRSGLPDSLENGLENDNIINGALRYQRQFERWTVDTHLSQFSQNRLLIHSLYSDSSLRFINRNSIDFQLRNNTGIEIGLSQQFQQYSSKAKLRACLLYTSPSPRD